jgi:uncharacterized protein (TIGR03437 family)
MTTVFASPEMGTACTKGVRHGLTKVTFNGVAASFTVASDTEIKAVVPDGATTGSVQVVTPSGTLTSNVRFRIE